ncbi:hypothetical protein C0J52_18233 [Blattella germanica]|nr:hypothetical protein C0J52_18233 [Blattella germanica]
MFQIFVVCGWVLAVICFILPLIYGHKFIQQGYTYNPLEFSLAYTFLRFIWCLGLIWLVFACTSGLGGPMNVILSWKGFQPLSRLSYGIYLFHVPIVFGINFSMRTPNYFSDLNEVQKFIGILVLTILLAIPVYLMVEAPTDYIMKTLLKDKKKPAENQIYPDVDISELKRRNQIKYQRNIPGS